MTKNTHRRAKQIKLIKVTKSEKSFWGRKSCHLGAFQHCLSMLTQWIHHNHYLELATRLFPTLLTGPFTFCSSADWPASPGPRRGRPHWWRTWPEYTSCGGGGSADRACLWFLQHSWHWASPEIDGIHIVSEGPSFCERTGARGRERKQTLPVCWQRPEEQHPEARPQPASSWVPPELRSPSHDHCCPPRRSNLQEEFFHVSS